MKKLGVTVIPLDLHARPIGIDDRALIRLAVMPSHAVADFQSFGLIKFHDGILPRERRSVPSLRTRTIYFGFYPEPTYGSEKLAYPRFQMFGVKGSADAEVHRGSVVATGNEGIHGAHSGIPARR
jgi:hypothetical protein